MIYMTFKGFGNYKYIIKSKTPLLHWSSKKIRKLYSVYKNALHRCLMNIWVYIYEPETYKKLIQANENGISLVLTQFVCVESDISLLIQVGHKCINTNLIKIMNNF